MNELHIFAGAGGGILAGRMLEHRCVCAVEWEPYAAGVLVARQNDGSLPPFPIWDDVQTFDGRPWRGIVDIVAGGFPCQDISVAGKGAGITGARSGMWGHMARIVGEVRPRFVFVENSPALLTRGLGVVLSDLAALGYDCRWTVLGAADVGAPHQRDRFWLVGRANTGRAGRQRRWSGDHQPERSSAFAGLGEDMANAKSIGWEGSCDVQNCTGLHSEGVCAESCRSGATAKVSDASGADVERRRTPFRTGAQLPDIGDASWWDIEPDVGRVANGVAARVDRLKAIGNGQVPLCAATAFRMLAAEFGG